MKTKLASEKNSLEQDFEPQVDYVEPIVGCTA